MTGKSRRLGPWVFVVGLRLGAVLSLWHGGSVAFGCVSVCELEYERVTAQPKQTLLLEDATLLLQPQPVTSSSVQSYRSGDESRHGDAVTKGRCQRRPVPELSQCGSDLGKVCKRDVRSLVSQRVRAI